MMGHSFVRASSYLVTRLRELVTRTTNRHIGKRSVIDDSRSVSQIHGLGIWGPRQVAVDLAGDVTLEHTDGFALGATVFDSALHLGLGLRIGSEPRDHDVPERVGCPGGPRRG
jgi:hypothetical protein